MIDNSNENQRRNVWEQHFLIKPEELAFDLHFFDLYSGEEKKLLTHLKSTLTRLKRPDLTGPIYLVIRELLTNSLKAIYKKLYLEFFINEMGLGDLSYEEWLMIFKNEIETHMADNFANMCRDKDMFVECRIKADEDKLSIVVINEGSPSDIEMQRLQKSFNRANSYENMAYLFQEDTTADDYEEGAGIGVPLISIILKNIHENKGDLKVEVQDGKTIASLNLPLTVFLPNDSQKLPV